MQMHDKLYHCIISHLDTKSHPKILASYWLSLINVKHSVILPSPGIIGANILRNQVLNGIRGLPISPHTPHIDVQSYTEVEQHMRVASNIKVIFLSHCATHNWSLDVKHFGPGDVQRLRDSAINIRLAPKLIERFPDPRVMF